MRIFIQISRILFFCVLLLLVTVSIYKFDLSRITVSYLTLLVVLNLLMGAIIILGCIRISLKECFSLFIYTSVYILFNLGYYILNLFTPNFGVIIYGYTSYTNYYSEAIALIIMFLGMTTFYITYMVSYKLKLNRRKRQLNNVNTNRVPNEKLIRVRQWSKIIMYFGAFFAFAKAFLAVIQVQQNGYSSIYTNISGYSNVIIDTFDAFYEIGLLCYLATNPPFKQMRGSIILYFIYSILTLFYGVRGEFVINVLIIVWYLMKRDNLSIDIKKFMTKTRMFFYALAGMGILYIMKVFSQLRQTFGSNVSISKISFFEGILGIVEEMGFSGRLVSVVVYNEDKLQVLNNGKAVLYPILNYFQNNVISRMLGFGFSDITSFEYLKRSYNFGGWLSYIFRPNSFVVGGGVGTNYLAESYIALGFFGVIFINVLLGILLRKVDQFKVGNWKTNAFFMNIISVLLFVPRDTFFRIIPESITMLLAIIIIDFITKKKYSLT